MTLHTRDVQGGALGDKQSPPPLWFSGGFHALTIAQPPGQTPEYAPAPFFIFFPTVLFKPLTDHRGQRTPCVYLYNSVHW